MEVAVPLGDSSSCSSSLDGLVVVVVVDVVGGGGSGGDDDFLSDTVPNALRPRMTKSRTKM